MKRTMTAISMSLLEILCYFPSLYEKNSPCDLNLHFLPAEMQSWMNCGKLQRRSILVECI